MVLENLNNSTSDLPGDTTVAKSTSIVILFLASTIAGFLPIKLNDVFRKKADRPSTFDKVMSFFLNFGGGVLLCTVFLHMLPEIRGKVITLEKDKVIPVYVLSYPELIMCIGFFMMFFVEETVHSFLMRTEKPNDANGVQNDSFSISSIKTTSNKLDVVPMKNCDVVPYHVGNGNEHKCFSNDSSRNYHSCENGQCRHVEADSHSHDLGSHSHIPDLSKPSINSFLTVLALSVHEIFEGLAVGLEKDSSQVWYMLAAVSCHKVVLAAFIGIQLITANVRKLFAYGYIISFALTSPLGIFAGLMLTEGSQSDAVKIVSAVLQAIATGTLLYIVFFEVFKKQFGDYKPSGLMRLLASVCGFVFMIGIQILLDDDDDDG